jgi:hypothetical protein
VSEQGRYNIGRVAAAILFVCQLVVTAVISQYAQDLELTRRTIALLGLMNIAIGGALLFLPRVQGDGKERET